MRYKSFEEIDNDLSDETPVLDETPPVNNNKDKVNSDMEGLKGKVLSFVQ
jgi:hypothetical protein